MWYISVTVLHHDLCNQVTSGILMQSDTENSAIAQAAITEEEIRFARHYNEGYNLAPGPKYLQ